MPVYPGDPKVSIKPVLTLAKDGWNMNVITLPAHIATHVNVPLHSNAGGRSLDDYPVDAFIGKSIVYRKPENIRVGIGLLFERAADVVPLVQKIIETNVKFVGVQGYFESKPELDAEKALLRAGIISFEGLVNLDKLPKGAEFTFYGVPLKIKNGDGSPIRAYAQVD
jgi:kynurenine formamidase